MPQASDRVTSYLIRAKVCRSRAVMTNAPEVRAAFLDMAHQWEMMARQIAQLEADRKQTDCRATIRPGRN